MQNDARNDGGFQWGTDEPYQFSIVARAHLGALLHQATSATGATGGSDCEVALSDLESKLGHLLMMADDLQQESRAAKSARAGKEIHAARAAIERCARKLGPSCLGDDAIAMLDEAALKCVAEQAERTRKVVPAPTPIEAVLQHAIHALDAVENRFVLVERESQEEPKRKGRPAAEGQRAIARLLLDWWYGATGKRPRSLRSGSVARGGRKGKIKRAGKTRFGRVVEIVERELRRKLGFAVSLAHAFRCVVAEMGPRADNGGGSKRC